MSQPANDDFSQHLSDDEASYHEDASDNVSVQKSMFVESTNKVKSGHTGAYSTYTPSTSSNNIPEREVSAGFADEVIYSLFAKQSEDLDLLHEDLEQIDDMDIEEMGNNPRGQYDGKKRDSFYQEPGAGRRAEIRNCNMNSMKRKMKSLKNIEISKNDSFPHKGVPHPLTGDYYFLNHTGIDESLYAYGKKGPQKPETSISDDTFSENSVTTNEKVISEPKPTKVEPSCVTHIKIPRQPMKNQGTPKVNKKNWNEMMERELGEGYSFIKKRCFVCGSLSHLIRNCNFYENKMEREVELKKQGVLNIGNGVAKPVWNNANRVNQANHFVPRLVQLIVVRQNVNSVRPNVNTGRAYVNSVRQNVNSVRSNVNTGRANVNYVRQNVNSIMSNINTSSFNINTVKAKQPIHTSNSNSFSAVRPQVLFIENEGLVVSPGSLGMPDENQILLKVPRQHNMYSFDMKTPTLTKDYACLIAKAHLMNLKLWHRKLGTRDFKQEYSNAETPHQNGVAERMNRTLIEAARTMLVDSLLPTNFWAEAVNIPEILAFRRELDELAPKHLREVPKNKATSITLVNSGSCPVNTQHADQDYSYMLELTIFNKHQKGIFNEASYDDEGMVYDFNNLPIEVAVSPIPILRIHNIHPQSQILGDPKSSMQNRSRVQQHLVAHTPEPKKISEALNKRIVVDEEVYVSQPPGFADPDHPKKVYKVVKALYGLHQAPRAWYATLSTFLEKHGYRKDMLKKFDLASVKTAITPMETKVALTKDEEAVDVDVTPKTSHLNAVKRIFKYLKGKPNLGLWYPRESPFDLEAFSDSDYGGSNLDRKSTTGGCQFLGQRLISWQCKKQTIVATSTTEAEYVAAANCCGQVLWVQNQLLDYGFNFMNTKIHIDNESTICIVKNPVYHSKTKHIEIRHHFIRDCYEKKLIRVEKIHTDLNVADLLTKPFDGPRFNFLVTATATTLADGTLELKATIDTIEYIIIEVSIRSRLQLADASRITISKSGGWDQFGSNIATALICLSTGRVYNFSKLIFDGMVANLKSKTKFLMYPRFLQMILDIQTENKHPYLAVTLTKKIFGNMKRGFRGVPRPLLPAMLSIVDPSAGQEAPSVTQPQPSSTVVQPTPPTTQPIPSEATTIPPLSQPAPPTPIAETTTASPSPSPSPAHEPMEHTFEQPSTDQQPPTPRQEATTSQLMTRIGDLEKQLKETKQTFGKAILTLVDRVKTLEVALKRKTKRVLLSDSEEEETEAQGRKTHDLDPLVSLVQELVTPSKTVNASGEEQVEDISPTTLEAAAILTKVQKIKSVDKGKRYKRRKSSKEFAGTGLDFEEVNSKSGGWDQFGSNIATALICLSTGRVYNFSKLIFDGMVANLKSKTKFLMYPRFLQMILDIQTENKHPYLAVTLTKKIFGNMKRGFRGVPRPLLPAMLSIVAPSAGQEAPSVTQPQPSSSVAPPTPPTPILMTRIGDLEKQLKETKQTFGKAILTLVERVKTLEVALKRKTKRVLLSDFGEEETEARGRKTHDLDPLVSLVQELVTPSKTVNALGEEQVEDISPTTLEAAAILTKVKKIKSVDKGKRYKRRKSSKEFAGTGLDFEEVNTGGIKVSSGIEEINAGSLDVNTGIDPVTTDSIRVSVPSPDRGRREGKAPMTEEEETQASRKTKEQILQEEAGLVEAIRLDALEKEEVTKQVHLDSLLAQRLAEEQELIEEQKKRKAQVQFEAQSYTEEDWDTIRAKLEANEKLKESVLGKDLTVEDYAKRMVELNQGTWKLTQLMKLNFEEVKAEFEKLVKQLDTYVPMNFEATKERLKRFGEELQTKTVKKLKFDYEGTQPTEEKIKEDKDDKPIKKTGKRRKQIARKGFVRNFVIDSYY
ncbi:putative ribonuclease H-like domain-containing protein [Tanacetum coccineum]